MLGVLLALMRVARPAVFAACGAALAHARATLIDDHAIARRCIGNGAPNRLDHTSDLMAEDLRRDREGKDATVIVRVVVRVTGHDVQIGAAESHRLDADEHLVWGWLVHGHVAHLDSRHVDEHGGAHRGGRRGRRHRAIAGIEERATPDHAAPSG